MYNSPPPPSLPKFADEQRRIVLKKISVQKRMRSRMTKTVGRWGKEGKVHPIACLTGPEGEQRCSFTLYLTLVLGGGGCSTPRLRRSSPWNDLVPILYEAGWTPGPVWTEVENLGPNGFRSQTVQPIASRYTDWAIPAHNRTVRSSVMCINGVIKQWLEWTLLTTVKQTWQMLMTLYSDCLIDRNLISGIYGRLILK